MTITSDSKQLPYEVKIHNNERSSHLRINARWFNVTVTIQNRFSVRNRRQFLLAINSALLSKLDFLHESYIHHEEHVPSQTFADSFPKLLSTKQSIHLKDDQAKLRYWIRGIRTRAGMTQIEFSKLLGITNHHLSKVEKGLKPISRILAEKVVEVNKALEL